MDRESLLIITSILLFAQGYLFVNISSSLLGFGIILYLLSIRLSFNPKVSIKLLNNKFGCNEDEVIEIVFNIKNYSKIPIILNFNKTNYYFKWEVPKILLNKDEEKEYVIKLIPNNRGRFELKNSFNVYDLNEIYFKEINLPDNIIIDIFPSVDDIKNEIRKNKNISLGKEVLSNLKLGFDSFEFEELREYVPGDNYRHIDWKATAKLDRLIVRSFLKESYENVCILLDISGEFRRGLFSDKPKVHYLSLLINALINIITNANKKYKLIFFDNNDIKKIIKGSDVDIEYTKKSINKYLKPLRGLSIFRINKIPFRKDSALLNTTQYIEGDVILITDIGLRYSELARFISIVEKKNINLYIISLNPMLFVDEKHLNEENIPKIYKRFIEREELVNKLNAKFPTVDLGPNDLLSIIFKGRK